MTKRAREDVFTDLVQASKRGVAVRARRRRASPNVIAQAFSSAARQRSSSLSEARASVKRANALATAISSKNRGRKKLQKYCVKKCR